MEGLTKEQRFAYFELGFREQIARNNGELPPMADDEVNPEWAEWAQGLLDASDRIASLEADLAVARQRVEEAEALLKRSLVHLPWGSRGGEVRAAVTAFLAARPEKS
jgi:hypothetical protein